MDNTTLEILKVTTTILAALIAAFIGSWFGANQALARFKKERAFDRQLEWYERYIRALHDMAQKIVIATTFEEENGDIEHRIRCWRAVQGAHLVLSALTNEAKLFGSAEAISEALRIMKRVDDIADKTDAFDPKDAKKHLEIIYSLSEKLDKSAIPIAEKAREHLGIGSTGAIKAKPKSLKA